MNKLTDLELCKRIAEIEGINIEVINQKVIIDEMIGSIRVQLTEYNPLTDDAFCFQLMVKYKISVIHHSETDAVYCVLNHERNNFTDVMVSTNRAICLAIIEAHKEL
tara:strand:+ start:884 stop:1204 length:321 start_codon:yes stop_codon:yes gene_type:complete